MLLSLLLLACADDAAPTSAAAPTGELVFVRDGVLLPRADAGPQGQPTSGDRVLVETPWTPGADVAVGRLHDIAPVKPECVPLFTVDLGDVSRLVAMGGEAPDTALAFSPDGRWLAVGSYRGEVLVVDAWSGAVVARQTLSEATVKQVAWAPDGSWLAVSEQSPDAFVRVLDPGTLGERWSLRLADIVEQSLPPDGEDLYGIYTLPAGFGLSPLADGSLLVVAGHSWAVDGVRRNRFQVLRLTDGGAIAARWPDAPASATFLNPAVSEDERFVALSVGFSADGDPPADLPVGGMQLLSLPDLKPVAAATAEPLEPWFHEARLWAGLAVSGASQRVLMGFGDGRLQLRDLAGQLVAARDTGAPILAGEVPIHVGIGWGALHAGQALVVTSPTRIPWGAAAPDLRPPSAHPAENSLQVLDAADGALAWSWSGDHSLQGLTISPDGDEAIVAAGARSADERRDLFGALVFDLGPGPAGGAERLRTTCSTEGPALFTHAATADGRIALVEAPEPTGTGGQRGAYRVTVFR
ncbi:MAG: PD40 domain-containing protein [Alphaproteobacteria bacterium]|nr:PD40 domain-containing protein [Alphaproteobacteria bacterium]